MMMTMRMGIYYSLRPGPLNDDVMMMLMLMTMIMGIYYSLRPETTK